MKKIAALTLDMHIFLYLSPMSQFCNLKASAIAYQQFFQAMLLTSAYPHISYHIPLLARGKYVSLRLLNWQFLFFFFLYIFMGFCVYVPLPPLRGQHTVLCHPRWLPTSGLTEFAVCWGGAGFQPGTTDLQTISTLFAWMLIMRTAGSGRLSQK